MRTGSEQLIGEVGEVREPLNPRDRSSSMALSGAPGCDDGSTIDLGTRVRIKSVDGLTLEVEPVADRDPASVEKGT